jgi:hypothetical protein
MVGPYSRASQRATGDSYIEGGKIPTPPFRATEAGIEHVRGFGHRKEWGVFGNGNEPEHGIGRESGVPRMRG